MLGGAEGKMSEGSAGTGGSVLANTACLAWPLTCGLTALTDCTGAGGSSAPALSPRTRGCALSLPAPISWG